MRRLRHAACAAGYCATGEQSTWIVVVEPVVVVASAVAELSACCCEMYSRRTTWLEDVMESAYLDGQYGISTECGIFQLNKENINNRDF